MRFGLVACLGGLMLATAPATAQTGRLVADVTFGYAGFVDDATKGYFVAGGSVRRVITSRISIGPELAIMVNEDLTRDRNVALTGNIVFDAYPHASKGARRVTPFLVGGLGIFWGRDLVRGGPYWSSDPAFTAGGGLRTRINRSLSAAAEYRIGWELHQRYTGTVGWHW